ncbi:MAG: glycoside hydrolase family 88 protein [Spirochaetes bacterium]|nr:glycoside hydrolase family 88 protein [Spirochaetota bacterium]
MENTNGSAWITDAWNDIEKKIEKTSRRIGASFPHKSVNGKYDNEVIDWWTNGFWPGLMWLMYVGTKNDFYKSIAEQCELKLDEALTTSFYGLHHDVGFMWLPTSVANYRITGNKESRRRGLIAAAYLCSRFNIRGNFIRAWNEDRVGWAIIDSMMNLPLLNWASNETGDPRYAFIAEAHAEKVMNNFIRNDGSVDHIVNFDPNTGEKIESFGGQGYENGSSWSRGQAWAIYGFVILYRNTGNAVYLDAAKRIAHYFMAALPDDFVAPSDFRAPAEGDAIKDVTATACAASALLDISESVSDYQKGMYENKAKKMLQSLYENYGAWNEAEEGLLTKGTIDYHQKSTRNIPVIYGDFYFVEAVMKLSGKGFSVWY